MNKANDNKRKIILYGLFGLLIGLILGILVTTTINPTGNALKVISQNGGSPVPAQITAVYASYEDCAPGQKAYFTFDWRALGENERYRAYLLDVESREMEVKFTSSNNAGYPGGYLNPKMSEGVQAYVILTGTDYKCADSYYLQIDSIKNNQIATSPKYNFSWTN